MRHLRVCLSVFVRAHVRICACVRHIHSFIHIRVCVCVRRVDDEMTVFIARPPRFLCGVCTWQSLEQ